MAIRLCAVHRSSQSVISLYLVDMHDKRSCIFMYHGFRIVNIEQVGDIVYYHIGLLQLHSMCWYLMSMLSYICENEFILTNEPLLADMQQGKLQIQYSSQSCISMHLFRSCYVIVWRML